MTKTRKKKLKIWSTRTADDKHSLHIRARDKRCLRCKGIENLTSSHFWSKGCTNTRFDDENCITLCYRCHYGAYTLTQDGFQGWEYEKSGDYQVFMKTWLGEEKYKELEKRARKFKSLLDARKEIQERLSHYQSLLTL